jgi:hypothetical protein
VRADPFNPLTNGGLVRFPGQIGFEMYELDYAEQQFKTLVSPMTPDRLQKLYNLRGVKTKSDQQTPVNNTVGSVTWKWIQSDFDANDSTPIKDGPKVPGDGTQPAWTACLATNGARCINVKGSTIEHAFLMNDTGVLDRIGGILCHEVPAMSPTETTEPEPASDEEIVEFLTFLSQHLRELRQVKSFDDPRFQKLLLQTSLTPRVPAIARRFLSDVLQRPGPDGLRPPDDSSRPTIRRAAPSPVASRAPGRRGARKSSKKKA